MGVLSWEPRGPPSAPFGSPPGLWVTGVGGSSQSTQMPLPGVRHHIVTRSVHSNLFPDLSPTMAWELRCSCAPPSPRRGQPGPKCSLI